MLNVQQLNIDLLRPWDMNPRHNDQAVNAVARSIQQFGFNVPILCDPKYRIIAGHTRYKAAQQLGLEHVPVIVLNLSGKQKELFAIAENKTSEIADWDNHTLSRLLNEFKDNDIDLSALGFSAAEMYALLAPQEDFDWSLIEQDNASHERDYALLPVKIPKQSIDLVKKLISEKIRIHSIRGKNNAIKAGLLIMQLLGENQ